MFAMLDEVGTEVALLIEDSGDGPVGCLIPEEESTVDDAWRMILGSEPEANGMVPVSGVCPQEDTPCSSD